MSYISIFRCPVYPSIPSYCRLVTSQSDTCCKEPQCSQPPTPQPNPYSTPRPNPNPCKLTYNWLPKKIFIINYALYSIQGLWVWNIGLAIDSLNDWKKYVNSLGRTVGWKQGYTWLYELAAVIYLKYCLKTPPTHH